MPDQVQEFCKMKQSVHNLLFLVARLRFLWDLHPHGQTLKHSHNHLHRFPYSGSTLQRLSDYLAHKTNSYLVQIAALRLSYLRFHDICQFRRKEDNVSPLHTKPTFITSNPHHYHTTLQRFFQIRINLLPQELRQPSCNLNGKILQRNELAMEWHRILPQWTLFYLPR